MPESPVVDPSGAEISAVRRAWRMPGKDTRGIAAATGAKQMTFGRVNPEFRLEDQGIEGLGNVYYNLMEPALIEAALKRGEGTLGKGGAFLVTTGKFTGRSPSDKFVVRTPAVEDTIWWESNKPMDPAGFDALHADMLEHMKGGDYYVQDLVGGADPANAIDVRVLQLAMDLRGRVLHADSPGPLDAGNCERPSKCWPPGRLYKFGQARVDLASYEWYRSRSRSALNGWCWRLRRVCCKASAASRQSAICGALLLCVI